MLLTTVVGYAMAIHHRLGRMKRLMRVRTERLQQDLLVAMLLECRRCRDPRHRRRSEAPNTKP